MQVSENDVRPIRVKWSAPEHIPDIDRSDNTMASACVSFRFLLLLVTISYVQSEGLRPLHLRGRFKEVSRVRLEQAGIQPIPFDFILFFTAQQDEGKSALQNLANDSSAEPRIVGGYGLSDRSRFPYFAQIWGAELCGGALIAPDIVVSAAHVSSYGKRFGRFTLEK